MLTVRIAHAGSDYDNHFANLEQAVDYYNSADSRGWNPIMAIVVDGKRIALIDDPNGYANYLSSI